MTRTLNACPDDDDGIRDEDDDCLLTKIEESEKITSLEQAKNQQRIKHEIKNHFLMTLGGWPTELDGKEVSYAGVFVAKLWGNRFRVNLKVKDKHGNVKYPHSSFVHYQRDNISYDEHSPVKKLFSNFKETSNETE